MTRFTTSSLAAVVAAGLLMSGCATKKYVASEVTAAESRVESRVAQRVDVVETQVESNQARLEDHERMIGEVSQTAREALDRAMAAGKLAEGKLLYEVVLTDQSVRFASDRSILSDEARAALGQFADRLQRENANVYVEVQGHTDSTGSSAYNMTLGRDRAQAAVDHLAREHKIPLHRMAVISYGEDAPVADNSNAAGRAENRRVVLVVLK